MDTIDFLRAFAVGRSLFAPTTLRAAIDRLGFVQADPIRAPARAQDLTLRHRVTGYRAGDLEQAYPGLAIEEDVFINYGFLARPVQQLMHPRTRSAAGLASGSARARAVLTFVRRQGTAHPREVDAYFSHGRVTNAWGGSSSATTRLLESMHYKGLLRVARRENGIRVYAACEPGPSTRGVAERRQRLDALVDVVVGKYAPLPSRSLSMVVRRLRYAVPQWAAEVPAALERARRRLAVSRVGGVDWYWPAEDEPRSIAANVPDVVRLLAPFDPVVWDRERFEMFWGWAYRFEAYTPPAKRKLGYYALPLLWRDRVVGWANASEVNEPLGVDVGYVGGRAPRDRDFRRELEAEIERLRRCVSIEARLRPDAPRGRGTRRIAQSDVLSHPQAGSRPRRAPGRP